MPLSLLLGIALTNAALPATPARPAKLGLCVACHGERGLAQTEDAPHLAAQRETYLASSLTAYRTGTRRHAAMQAVAGTLSARDIDEFARWYAAQPPPAPIRKAAVRNLAR